MKALKMKKTKKQVEECEILDDLDVELVETLDPTQASNLVKNIT